MNILFFCIEPSLIADYMQLLPADLLSALVEKLPKLPTTDEEWSAYKGIAQLDDDESSWAEAIAKCRVATEAARVYLLGSAQSPATADFLDRVRAACLTRIAKYPRTVEEATDSFP